MVRVVSEIRCPTLSGMIGMFRILDRCKGVTGSLSDPFVSETVRPAEKMTGKSAVPALPLQGRGVVRSLLISF
jgi:hypothetical protein